MIFPLLLSIAVSFDAGQQKAPAAKKPAPPHSQPKSQQATNYVPAPPKAEDVLARVNGIPIRAKAVNEVLWDWAGKGVLEDMILFELVKQRAALDKITVTPAQVEEALQKQLGEIQPQVPPGQDLESFIREKGFPKSRLYLHIEADLMMSKIVDFNFKKSNYISVSTILVPSKSPAATDLQEAVGKAQTIYKRLTEKGESWDTVAAGPDQSPQLVQTKGVLGWRAVEAFPPGTTAELKTLKVKGITKPVQTQYGIQIFRVDAFGTSADDASLAALKKEYEPRAKQSLAQDLMKAAKIDRIFGKPAEKPKVAGKGSLPGPVGLKQTNKLQKLIVTDTNIGTGEAVAAGDEVWVIYTGTFANGSVFDTNSKPGGQPFHFVLGMGYVIKGWDQGLVGMKVGGKRKLSIPYALAYGDRENGPIPAQSDLYFDVELVKLQKKK